MNYVLLANWTVFFPIALSLFVAMRLTVGSIDSSRPTLYRAVSSALVTLLLVLSIVGICCRFGPLSLIWLIAVGGMLIVLAIKHRDLKRSAFLLTLFNCAEQPSTVFTLASSFAAENSGWLRRRCQRLKSVLQRTGDWGMATEAAGLVRGARQRLALRLFSRLGKHGLIRREIQFGHASEGLVDSLLMRLLVALLSGWGLIIVSLLLIFIFPTFAKMQQEFNNEESYALAALQEHQELALLLSNSVPAVLTLIACGVSIVYLFPNLLAKRPLVWFFRSYYRALTFLGLAEIADDDQPLNNIFRKLAEIHPVSIESNKLARVARQIEQGMTARNAFRKTGFLNRSEARLLELALEQHHAGWTFRQLGEICMERCLRRYSVIVQVVMVLITLVIAAVVGVFAWATLEFLTSLIESIE